MSWDWGTTVAGVVGIAGIVGTYLGARHQGNVTVRMAREERRQGRLERAYQEVQRAVDRYAQWADATMPLISVGDHDPHPPLPGNDGPVLEASALRLYWSPEVRRLVQAWTDARNQLAVQSLAARAHESLTQNAWLKAQELKPALRAAEEALLARMAYELLAVEPLPRRWQPQVARRRPRTVAADADTAAPVPDRQRASAN
jgi:hypothetical protein